MLKDLLFAGMHAALSFIKPRTNAHTRSFVKDTGGFLKGVCHPPDGRMDELKEANIQCVRFDVCRPLDENGQETASYIAFKERARRYRDAGYRVMAVTPFPGHYSPEPFTPSDPAWREIITRDILYLAKDLQGLVAAFQVSNEMQVEHFRFPLTEDMSIEFLAIQLEALYPARGKIKVGFNLQNFTMVSYLRKMRPWVKYCDYIGLDLYLGCFETFFKEITAYDFITRFIWSYTRKPVCVNEFGYIGKGAAKSPEEKKAILQQYEAESEEEARADIRRFIDRLPDQFRHYLLVSVENPSDEELGRRLFSGELKNHLYRELPADMRLTHYAHTSEDQARFMTDVIRRLRRLPFVVGAFVYCYSDAPVCGYCGQADCPVETGWGLIDVNGNRKPSWYAVRDAFRT